MIDSPSVRLSITQAERFEARGPLAERVAVYARRAAAAWSLAEMPPCRIDVLSAPPEHVGLGVGTQLGLSVAAGLNRFLDREPLEPAELARVVSRGQRSAIGTHGFAHGGMVVEAGKRERDEISPQLGRAILPAEWRFVLVRPKTEVGIFGDDESGLFSSLPPVPPDTTLELCRLALEHLLPAAEAGHFDEFSASLYRYGRLAGECFAAKQGGPFASRLLADLVETIQRLGVRGVGQSSWGPTLFALLRDEAVAGDFVDALSQQPNCGELEMSITAPNNTGARIEAV